jgi:hypothetical protein
VSVTIKPGEMTVSCVSEYCEIVDMGPYEGEYGFKWRVVYGSSILFEDSEIIQRHSTGSDNSDANKKKSKAYSFIAQPGYTYKTYGAEADTAPAGYVLLETYVCPSVPGAPTGLTNPDATDLLTLSGCTFSWTNDSDATHVSFLLGDTPGNMSVVLDRYAIDATTNDTQITLPLGPDKTYYWQVVNHNESGDARSAVQYVTTPAADNYTPGELTLTSPSNGVSTPISASVTFVWQNGSDADTREVQIGRQEGVFDTIVGKAACSDDFDVNGDVSEGGGYDSVQVELLPNTQYFWRIVNYNTFGATYSETRTFKTAKVNPYAPQSLAVTGESGGYSPSRNVTFTWTDNSVSGESPEKVSVEVRPEGGSPFKVLDKASPVLTCSAILMAETTYYWRVINHYEDRDVASADDSFMTPVANPKTPALYSPTNNATSQEYGALALYWNDGDSGGEVPDFMSLQIATGAGSFKDVFTKKRPSTIDLEVGETDYYKWTIDVEPNTNYYWRVINHWKDGDNAAAAWKFTTKIADEQRALLHDPIDGFDEGVQGAISLEWYYGNSAGTDDPASADMPERVSLYIGANLESMNPVLERVLLSDVTKTADQTISGVTGARDIYSYDIYAIKGNVYYWKVVSHWHDRDAISVTNSFYIEPSETSGASAPTAPTLTYSPAEELANTTENVTLTWEVAGLATEDTAKFSVYISKDFASPVTVLSETNKTSDGSGVFSLSVPVSAGSVYYWFVEYHVGALSTVSDTETFSVDSPASASGETPPKEPELTVVGNQANTVESVNLVWSDADDGGDTPDTYTVYLSRDYNAPVKVLEGASATKQVAVTVVAGSEYTWWVESHANGVTENSSVDTFSVADPDTVDDPAKPTLTSPTDGSSEDAGTTSVTLQWNIGGGGTDDAVFSIYTSKDFAAPTAVAEQITLTAVAGTYSFPIQVEADTTYYWRIVHHENGLSTSSSTYDFSISAATSATPAKKPLLRNPDNGDINESFLDKKLEWDEADSGSEVSTVTIKIGTDSNLLATTVDSDDVAGYVSAGSYDYEFTLTAPLEPDTVYYWQVTHHCSDGVYTSEIEWFKTKPADTGRVTSVTWNNSTKVLTWSEPDGVPDGYYLYIGTDSLEVSNADTDSEIVYKADIDAGDPGETYTFSNAVPQTLYFWRIDAYVDLDKATPPKRKVTRGVVRTFFTGTLGLAAVPITTNDEKLVYVTDDSVKYANINGDNETDAGIAISSGENLDMLCAFNKCFIVNGTTKKVIDFTNIKLTVSGLGADTKIPQRDTIFYQDNGGSGEATTRNAAVIDYIDVSGSGASRELSIYAQVTNGTITEDETIANRSYWLTEDGDIVEVDVEAVTYGPHVYDWAAYPEKADGYSDNGEMPDHVDMAELYAGQIILASSKSNIFYMSAPDNPFSYAFYEDTGSFASATAYTGKLGYNLNAVIPFRDDVLVLASSQSLWMFRGSPSSGASLDNVSNEIGVHNHRCWTTDGAGRLYFMDKNGVYLLDGAIRNLSNNAFPRFSNEFNLDDYQYLSMVFDKYNNGVLISGEGYGQNKSFFVSLDTGGFFEQSFDSSGGITSAIYDGCKMLLGCKDGGIRFFDEDAVVDVDTDDTENDIESEVLFGPAAISRESSYTAILNSIEAVLDISGGSVGVKLYVGQTASEVISNYESDSYSWSSTFSSGYSYRKRPRRRSNYIGVLLYNRSQDTTWAMERVILEIIQKGKLKRG